MSRQGREFELLIEKIEKIVLPEGASISSPGFIKDRITGEQREVDILIEHNVGTFHIVIVIECRNRASIQDTTWIEQIHSKLNDIKVNKAIAVSTSAFSKPAIEKAKFYNIETRTYKEINTEFIKSWWRVNDIKMFTRQFNILGVTMQGDNCEVESDFFNGKNVETKFINRTTDERLFSVNDIFSGICKKISDWDVLVPNGASIRKTIIVEFTNTQDGFFITQNESKINLEKMFFDVELSLVIKNIPLSRAVKYESGEKEISSVVEFDDFPIGENLTLQFIKNADGSISLSARKK